METKKVEEFLEEKERRYIVPFIFLIDDRYYYANLVCERFIEMLLEHQDDGISILAWVNPSVSIITFGGTVELPTGNLTVSCEEALSIIYYINERTMSRMSEINSMSILQPAFEAKSLFGQALRELDRLLTNMGNEYAKSRFRHPKIILIGDGHFDDDWEDALRTLEENSVFRRCFPSRILEGYDVPYNSYNISVASVPVGESPNKDALIRFSNAEGYRDDAVDAFYDLTTIYD